MAEKNKKNENENYSLLFGIIKKRKEKMKKRQNLKVANTSGLAPDSKINASRIASAYSGLPNLTAIL